MFERLFTTCIPYSYVHIIIRCMYIFGNLYIGAVSVSFNQTSYRIVENVNVVQPVLVLSNPSSTDVTVTVSNTGGSATGEWPWLDIKTNFVIIKK